MTGDIYEVEQRASQSLRKQVPADLQEREKPSLLSVIYNELEVPKSDGKQWLSCHAIG